MLRRNTKWLLSELRKIIPWSVSAIGLPTIIAYAHNPRGFPLAWWAIGAALIGIMLISWLIWDAIVRHLEWGIGERYARSTEVEDSFRLCRGFYSRDDHVINCDSLRCFMATNSRTVKVFEKEGKPVGLYIVFAINSEAVRKILDGTILNAQVLNARYVVKDRGKPAGLYVTNICARGIIARGRALKSLKEDLTSRISHDRSIKFIFARMANGDGGRLIRKYGFKKIHEGLTDVQVWKYEVVPKLPIEAQESEMGM